MRTLLVKKPGITTAAFESECEAGSVSSVDIIETDDGYILSAHMRPVKARTVVVTNRRNPDVARRFYNLDRLRRSLRESFQTGVIRIVSEKNK